MSNKIRIVIFILLVGVMFFSGCGVEYRTSIKLNLSPYKEEIAPQIVRCSYPQSVKEIKTKKVEEKIKPIKIKETKQIFVKFNN